MPVRILLVLAATLAAGCRSKAERYLDDHPDRPAEIHSAMVEGRIVPGMTFEEVRLTCGVPHRLERIEGDEDQIWYYGDPVGLGVGVAGVRVLVPLIAAEGVTQVWFKGGRVVEVSESRSP